MPRRRRHRLHLIPGPILIGFSSFFDEAYGKVSPGPYPKVTPASIGGTLLPFTCPHCNSVRSAVIDKKTRLGYYDELRGFSWCPACRGRYIINPEGKPLEESLSVGATYAPATVERGGKTEVLQLQESGFDVLGCI